jgi:hypothetical protein
MLLVGLVLVALPARSALADTTIGQVGGNDDCGGGNAVVLGDENYALDISGGTITSFSYQSTPANKGQQLDFLILRVGLGEDATFQVLGKTGLVTLQGTGLETFSANIPVQAGYVLNILGFWIPDNEDLQGCVRDVGSRGGLVFSSPLNETPDPGVGDIIFPIDGPFSTRDLNVRANMVTPPGSKPPTSQCKHGGWESFGTLFKNQGDCTSFGATGGKNTPSGP